MEHPDSRPFMFLAALLAALFLLAPAAPARATRVTMSGETYVYAASFQNRNFTGWTPDGAQTEDAFSVWQRLRLRSDFIQDENLAFSLWLQVDNTPWGGGYATVDNPAVAVQVFKAYLQFKWPGSEVEFTLGKATVTLPQSEAFNGSVVLDTEYPALAVQVPLAEGVDLLASYGRPIGYTQALEDVSSRPTDVVDLAWLSLPVTRDGWSLTPWAATALFLRTGAPRAYAGGDAPDLGYIRRQIFSIGYFTDNRGFAQATVPYVWGGLAGKFQAGDFTLFADLAGGSGGVGEAARNTRRGLFADAAVEYGGFDKSTPRVFGWISPGEDADVRNGSERLPTVVRTWNAGVSYLFSTGQTFDNSTSILADPTGAWGIGATLDNVSFLEGLRSRLNAVYMRGLSDPAAFRRAVAFTGPGYMAVMGKNLTVNESLAAVNFDHELAVTEQLKLVAETGWAHPMGLQKSVWGPRFVHAAQDSWKVAVGLTYRF